MAQIYAVSAIIGVMAIPASFMMGFRYSADAAAISYLWNLLLFALMFSVSFIYMEVVRFRIFRGIW